MNGSVLNVAVVGAGFTGVALAIQLSRKLPEGSRVLLFGAPGETGFGLAYAQDNPELLLNVAAGRMSVEDADPGQFTRWLAERCSGGAPISAEALGRSFVSRASYGRYLRDMLYEAADGPVPIDVKEGTVVELRAAGLGYHLRLASGERFHIAAAAFCLGNAPGRFRLPKESVETEALPRLIADPWNDYRMRDIGPEDRVLLAGAGLTMVDQVLGLRRAGHRGRITALSRHGRLPMAHADVAAEPVRISLPSEPGLRPLVRAVVKAGREAAARGDDWRAVVDGLRPVTQELWQTLNSADQRRFLRHVESYWSVFRHRMAPSIAAKIEALRKDGNLETMAARIVAVRSSGGPVRAALRRRGSRVVDIRTFDWIVNCTGPGRFAGLSENPLIARLLELGAVRPDALGLGLDVDRDCRVVGATGIASPDLFALGPLSAGRFFEITSVRDIRIQAAEVAARMAASARKATPPLARFRRHDARDSYAF
jgi:uncharacterized NAD(P)/FAD-binding protein YdhS